MMKNYFESENCIVPFEKVVSVSVVGTELYVYLVQHNIPKDLMQWYEFPIDQLANYKLWLEQQDENNEINKSMFDETIATAKKQQEFIDFQMELMKSQSNQLEIPNSSEESQQKGDTNEKLF